ncbi:MAG: hypothetical protein CVU91_07430 [Firmicutes bacterium HGW-Firmicutes-16]|nr:MAG: hypothetical protein CVU91_07430 [Firmicutes bacterium HGW-Firmicutes-16]
MNEKKTTPIEEPILELVFKKPYMFEGTEYKSVDLSKLEDWTGGDIDKAKKTLKSMDGLDPQDMTLPESNSNYCRIVASMVTGLPFEFFKNLKARDSRALDVLVIGFFLS